MSRVSPSALCLPDMPILPLHLILSFVPTIHWLDVRHTSRDLLDVFDSAIAIDTPKSVEWKWLRDATKAVKSAKWEWTRETNRLVFWTSIYSPPPRLGPLIEIFYNACARGYLGIAQWINKDWHIWDGVRIFPFSREMATRFAGHPLIAEWLTYQFESVIRKEVRLFLLKK